MKVNIEIDLDYIRDDGTLAEDMRSSIFRSLVDRSYCDSQKEIGAMVAAELEKQIAPIIEKALLEPFHIFNRYGAKTTEVPIDLTTMIRECATNYVTAKVDSKSGNPTSSNYDAVPRVEYMLKKLIIERFDSTFKTEISKIANEAKEIALKKAASEMAEVMAKRLGER